VQGRTRGTDLLNNVAIAPVAPASGKVFVAEVAFPLTKLLDHTQSDSRQCSLLVAFRRVRHSILKRGASPKVGWKMITASPRRQLIRIAGNWRSFLARLSSGGVTSLTPTSHG